MSTEPRAASARSAKRRKGASPADALDEETASVHILDGAGDRPLTGDLIVATMRKEEGTIPLSAFFGRSNRARFNATVFAAFDRVWDPACGKMRNGLVQVPIEESRDLQSDDSRQYMIDAPIGSECRRAWLLAAFDQDGKLIIIQDQLQATSIRGCPVKYKLPRLPEFKCTAVPSVELARGVASFPFRILFKANMPKKLTHIRFILITEDGNGPDSYSASVSNARFGIKTASDVPKKMKDDALSLPSGPIFFDTVRKERLGRTKTGVDALPGSPPSDSSSLPDTPPPVGPPPSVHVSAATYPPPPPQLRIQQQSVIFLLPSGKPEQQQQQQPEPQLQPGGSPPAPQQPAGRPLAPLARSPPASPQQSAPALLPVDADVLPEHATQLEVANARSILHRALRAAELDGKSVVTIPVHETRALEDLLQRFEGLTLLAAFCDDGTPDYASTSLQPPPPRQRQQPPPPQFVIPLPPSGGAAQVLQQQPARPPPAPQLQQLLAVRPQPAASTGTAEETGPLPYDEDRLSDDNGSSDDSRPVFDASMFTWHDIDPDASSSAESPSS